MHDQERDLLTELRRRAVWSKYRGFLPKNYFGTLDAKKLHQVINRLHEKGDRDVLPLTWITREMGKKIHLDDPLPEEASNDYVARALANARMLHWQEWVASSIEQGGTIDLTPMRIDLLEFDRQLNGSISSNGSHPLRALDILKKRDWEKTPRTPTYLHKGLDKYLGGGVGPGQLCVLQAPAKTGKSSFLYTIAYRAAVAGLSTYLFSCENYEDQIGERLDQIHKSNKKLGRKFPENLWVDYRHNPCLADLEHLTSHLTKLDMLVVDYADNMRATRTDGPDFVWTIDELYDGIRHIARGRNAIAWTATQERDPPYPWMRKSMRKTTYGSDKKIHKCDFFLGVRAHEGEGTATLTVLGRRGRGKIGADFEVAFEQDTCEIYELD